MDFSTFKKAAHFVDSDKIVAEGFGNNRSFWKVGENGIELRQEASGFRFLCKCTHGSIMAVHNPVCSHILALITYLTLLKRGKSKEEPAIGNATFFKEE